MSDAIIRVENLSKKYVIDHQLQQRPNTLRDVIASSAKSVTQKLLRPSAKKFDDPAHEDFWALKDVSFEINQGDRVGIIGRNGAGKSTLLKILSRITEPTTGSVRIKGRVASLLEVGTGFHGELTGRENIFLNGAILGMSKEEIKRKFDEIVAFAEVEKFLDTPVKRYSSGMYVRLAFAVAAHLEPEILIVDEVLAVGDAAFQKKCIGKMENVSTKEGRTVLFVSHNMPTVLQLTRTGLLLQQGKLSFFGPSDQATQHYLDSTSYSVDVYNVKDTPRPMPELNREVELCTLEIENCPTKLIPVNSDLNLKISIYGNKTIHRIRFSMVLFRIDGTPVGSFWTSEKYEVRQGETALFRLHLMDLRLATGKYYFNVAVGTGSYKEGFSNFDAVFDVLHFEVMPIEEDGAIGMWHPTWGAIQFKEPILERLA